MSNKLSSKSLAVKYRPKTFEDVVEQSVVTDILKNIATNSDNLTLRNFLLIGSAGTGKAQPLYSKVLTPDGFVNMGDIKVGDCVFTGKGNVGRVSGIYPQGERDIYEICLQDRTSIRVSDEHLNVVYRYNASKKEREDFCLTTNDLIQLFKTSKYKLRIDIPEVDWEEQKLPIHPYLLGALIGDGCFSNNFQFSNSENDVVLKVDHLLRCEWGKCLKRINGTNCDYSIIDANYADHKYSFVYKGDRYETISDMKSKLVDDGYPSFDDSTLLRIAFGTAKNTLCRYPELGSITCYIDENYVAWNQKDLLKDTLCKLGLLTKSVHKRIPSMYLYSSKEQRQLLLQGLFDTDGYTDKEGLTTFTTCSPGLSEDFSFLVRSLGIRDTVVSYPSKYKVKGEYKLTGSSAYDHNLKIPNDFVYCSSNKHISRRKARQYNPMRNIVDIKYIGKEKCQCIMIDHPDHTYISDNFIPTHNTTCARILANELNHGEGEPIEIDAASNNGVDAMRGIVDQAKTYPIVGKYKVFILDECHALSASSWQILLKVLEEAPAASVFMLATTNPEKIPETILSRVMTFQLSKISLSGIFNRLKYVLDKEIESGRNIKYEEDAVNFIAKLGNGGMRDSLTLLDTALSYSNNITMENVEKSLNLPNYNDYFSLLQSIAKKDNKSIIETISSVYNSGVNFVKWFEGFHSFVINIVKYINIQDINMTMIPSTYLDKISKYGPAHCTICLKLSNILVKLIHELKSTNYQQEMAITYLCSAKKG